jgi:hypothetical protein
MSSKTYSPILWVVLTLIIALMACNLPSSDNQSSTVDALAQSISLTATAAGSGEVSPEDALKTAEAKATADSFASAATKSAGEVHLSEAEAATATAIAPILDELHKYGVEPESGEVAWIHPPLTVEVEGYQQSKFQNYFIGTIARDFVMSSDITWNTQYGTSGCGFVLRSDGNEDEPSNYMVMITRFAEGHVAFMIVSKGEMGGLRDMYIPDFDKKFDINNDSTNNLTVVGRANILTIYTNGKLIGEIDTTEPPPKPSMPSEPIRPEGTLSGPIQNEYDRQMEQYKKEIEEIQQNFQMNMSFFEEKETDFREGFVSMGAMNESGKTTCQFNNTWLFLIHSAETPSPETTP